MPQFALVMLLAALASSVVNQLFMPPLLKLVRQQR
jgi:hypothetical protein